MGCRSAAKTLSLPAGGGRVEGHRTVSDRSLGEAALLGHHPPDIAGNASNRPHFSQKKFSPYPRLPRATGHGLRRSPFLAPPTAGQPAYAGQHGARSPFAEHGIAPAP